MRQQTFILIYCCDCGKFLAGKDGKGQMGMSHSFCGSCHASRMAEIEEMAI